MNSTIHQIWTDGRSGRLGRLVGDLVLSELAKRFGPISHRKGTIFETAGELIVGRICATDRYLPYPEVHWSTFDPGQERHLRTDHELAERKFYYLFITGMPRAKTIAFWLIPARVIAASLAQIKPRKDGSIFVRIRDDQGKSILNETDITRYRHRIDFDAAQQAEVETAESFQVEDRTRSRGGQSKADKNMAPPAPGPAVLPDAYVALPQASTVIIGRDGELLLPLALRRQFSLAEGTRAVAYNDGERIIIKPVRPHEHRTVRGTLKGTGAFKALIDERKREKEL
ncbi:MAG: AbrB/MazE/SpoVT family DNA-binding domain-containing protein [Tepidisphaeraceae bacterium]|jgi:bifunctional DNA-binding transcriptional regulator/antitoxin component of YhaV-PrlF toxin-antitoxin module